MERKPAAKRVLIIIVLMLGLSPMAMAADEPISDAARAAFEQTIESLRAQKADFRQERHITGLSRPLHSSGSIEIDAEGTLFWVQDKPFPVLIKMMPGAIEETVADDPPHTITRAQNPYLVTFSEAFVSLFTGHPETLSTLFTLAANHVASGWQIQLVPKDENVKNMIAMILISGDQRLDQIRIMESGTNQTTIYLTY